MIADSTMSVLVDTGASNPFILEEAKMKLNLPVKKGAGGLKTVNSKEVPVCSAVEEVEVHIGKWSDKETIEVIPLDNYDFVISIVFS